VFFTNYHIFRKNSVLVHAKTTTSYDTVENALMTNTSNDLLARAAIISQILTKRLILNEQWILRHSLLP
jgi:hypothetical protein